MLFISHTGGHSDTSIATRAVTSSILLVPLFLLCFTEVDRNCVLKSKESTMHTETQ